jgi:hypothetical protein
LGNHLKDEWSKGQPESFKILGKLFVSSMREIHPAAVGQKR